MSCESGGTCLRAFVQAAATVATKVPQVRFQADALVRVLPLSASGSFHAAVARAAPLGPLLEHPPPPALFADSRVPTKTLVVRGCGLPAGAEAGAADPDFEEALVALERLLRAPSKSQGAEEPGEPHAPAAARAALQLVGVAVMRVARGEVRPALLFVRREEFVSLGLLTLDAPVQTMEAECYASPAQSAFLRQLLVSGGEPDPENALQRWERAHALWRRTLAFQDNQPLEGLEEAMRPPFERCTRAVTGVLPFLRLSAPATLAQIYQCEATLVRALRFHRGWASTLSENAGNDDIHGVETGFAVAASALSEPLRTASVFQGGGVGPTPDAAVCVLRAEASDSQPQPLSALERRSVVAYSEPRGVARMLAGVATALVLGVTSAATAESNEALVHVADSRPQFEVTVDQLAMVVDESFERACAGSELAKPRHLTRDPESLAPPQFASTNERDQCLDHPTAEHGHSGRSQPICFRI